MIRQAGPEDMSGKGLKCPGGTSVQKDHHTGDINVRSKGCRGKEEGTCPHSPQLDQQGRKKGLGHGKCYHNHTDWLPACGSSQDSHEEQIQIGQRPIIHMCQPELASAKCGQISLQRSR